MIILEYVLSELARVLPFPKRDANKYSRGKLTVVGGSAQFPGAASLAAMAAQSMGAGYVEVICAPESADVIRVQRPSLVVTPWSASAVAHLACASNGDGIADAKGRSRSDGTYDTRKSDGSHPEAVLVGPGLSDSDPLARELTCNALKNSCCPVVVDGGAISFMATAEGRALCQWRADLGFSTVVTPHMGEAARLAKQARIEVPSPNAAEGSLARFASSLACSFSSVIVLKGPTTFIAVPDKDEVYAMRQGTSALAKAGSGDVLSGMTASIFAQHTEVLKGDPGKTCALAATLHAISGRAAAEKKTDISVNPEDLVDNIHSAIRYLLEFA